MSPLPGNVASALGDLLELGGPVVLVLLALSVLALATTLYKLWQHGAARVGQHARLKQALAAWDRGEPAPALRLVDASRSHLAPLVAAAMRAADDPAMWDRLEAEAEADLGRLERGFRLLDSIAQIAPLLGLFGTVLGMIDAFRALQAANTAVDPSVLAGGIWVALLTTAAGLAVAMPTSLILTWLESRTARERGFAELALARIRAPMGTQPAAPAATIRPAHA